MSLIPHINIDDYNYSLTDDKIAKFPLAKRDGSSLLVYKSGNIVNSTFAQLGNYLSEKALLVFNNSKVINARLQFKKETGASIEIFCLEPDQPAEYNLSFQQNSENTWKCLVGNRKKWKSGKLLMDIHCPPGKIQLCAEKIQDMDKHSVVKFTWNGGLSFSEIIEYAGKIPIPPYLNRQSEQVDQERYQTVYSKINGSVAAPTAGLHFTDDVFQELHKKKIQRLELTLHVSAGTFRPVQSNTIEGHKMHNERFEFTIRNIHALLEKTENIIAVGTTSTRILESIYWLGVKLLSDKTGTVPQIGQWDCYRLPQDISTENALCAIIQFMERNNLEQIKSDTEIIIVPGYKFRVIHGLITNFHQPKSTLLLLISALVGDHWKTIYQHALDNHYRFLSYGDSSLLIPQPEIK